MIWLVALLIAQGTYDPTPALVYGIGSESCKALSKASEADKARDWVLAAWSGKNGEFGHVGDSLGARGIVAQVKKQCASQSFMTIALATDYAFEAAAKQ